ncbi:MAG: hypothetical protein HC844_06625 [Tabrizicola sp.]|nr:hypothetical protein [Tabrizicola sp.]
MRHVIIFQDNPDIDPAVRSRYMPAHLSFLERNAARILAAGPLSGDAMAGGLWIVEAETRAEVEDLVREDPFWATGLRASWQLFIWRRVFEAGQRLI